MFEFKKHCQSWISSQQCSSWIVLVQLISYERLWYWTIRGIDPTENESTESFLRKTEPKRPIYSHSFSKQAHAGRSAQFFRIWITCLHELKHHFVRHWASLLCTWFSLQTPLYLRDKAFRSDFLWSGNRRTLLHYSFRFLFMPASCLTPLFVQLIEWNRQTSFSCPSWK